MSKNNILAVDPSLCNFGMVVFKPNKIKPEILEISLITTERNTKYIKSEDAMIRVKKIYKKMKELILKYNVVSLVYEMPTGSQSASSALSAGLVKGALASIIQEYGLIDNYVMPIAIKKVITGSGSASKKSMMEAIAKIYPKSITQFKSNRTKHTIIEERVKKSYEHIADAIAVMLSCLDTNAYKTALLLQ